MVSALPAGFDMVGALGASFELEPTAAEGPKLLSEMDHVGALALITASGCWLATPRATGPAAGYELDSSRIDAALAALPPHDLAYEHDIAQALMAVRTGRGERSGLLPSGDCFPDRPHSSRGRPDAAEDDIFLAEATYRHGDEGLLTLSAGARPPGEWKGLRGWASRRRPDHLGGPRATDFDPRTHREIPGHARKAADASLKA